MNKLVICSICSARIEFMESHNALPINDGRCCEQCNREFVLPARVQRASQSERARVFSMEKTSAIVKEWLKNGKKFQLEKPQGSSFHHMEEFFASHDGDAVIRKFAVGMPPLQSFVVEHDWGAVLDDDVGEFILPYSFCSFEFRISGMRCIHVFNAIDDKPNNYANFLGCEGSWLPFPTAGLDDNGKLVSIAKLKNLAIEPKFVYPLYEFVFRQVRAICVMFESSVAIKETIRAPEKLNRQREKRGRTQLRDYHVVILNRRPRPEPVPTELQTHGERNSPRLHFRRGHYRHFVNHRTWISWQLVGDPDLGFVDKHYRLT